MSAEPYIGEIMLFAGNYVPEGWVPCVGQLLSVNNYPALYSLLGTNFGGDGRNNFAVPDLRGKAPTGAGTEPAGGWVCVGDSWPSKEVMVGLGEGLRTKLSSLDSTVQSVVRQLTEIGSLVRMLVDKVLHDKTDPLGEEGPAVTVAESVSVDYLERYAQECAPVKGNLGLTFCIATEGVYPPRS